MEQRFVFVTGLKERPEWWSQGFNIILKGVIESSFQFKGELQGKSNSFLKESPKIATTNSPILVALCYKLASGSVIYVFFKCDYKFAILETDCHLMCRSAYRHMTSKCQRYFILPHLVVVYFTFYSKI